MAADYWWHIIERNVVPPRFFTLSLTKHHAPRWTTNPEEAHRFPTDRIARVVIDEWALRNAKTIACEAAE